MGFIRDLIAGRSTPLADLATGATTFAVDIDTATLYGTPTIDDYIKGLHERVSRKDALRVPAVKKARDLIAGSIGSLPLRLYSPEHEVMEDVWSFLGAPEAGIAPSVTWTRVAEDLLFDGVAWLRVTHVGVHGLPVEVKRLDPNTVTVQPTIKTWRSASGSGTAKEWPVDPYLIRIESPNEPLLEAGALAIRTCLALLRTTNNAASGLPPVSYFTPKDGVDHLEDDEIEALLTAWHKARGEGITGYVPGALSLESLGWNPEQLQLDALRASAVLEIARITGVDPEELGVSTTSRTYFNAWDRKQDYIQFTLGPYLKAIEGRVSLNDVTMRDFVARFDTDEFFKADTLARFQAYEVGERVGAITRPEIRAAEGKPALPEAAPAPTKPVQEDAHV